MFHRIAAAAFLAMVLNLAASQVIIGNDRQFVPTKVRGGYFVYPSLDDILDGEFVLDMTS